MSGDTVIGGLSYHFVSCDYNQGYIREDNKVIYFLPDTGSVEYKLYDFNLTVGDTLLGFYSINGPDSSNYIFYEDSVLASDGYHRRLMLGNNAYWVEGVGNLQALLFPLMGATVSGTDRLTCAMNDSLFNYAPLGYSCTNLGGANSIQKREWTIFPNPTNDYFTVDWEPETMSTFALTDALGRVLWEINANNAIGKQFQLPTQGVYLLIGRTVGGEMKAQRIVRQ